MLTIKDRLDYLEALQGVDVTDMVGRARRVLGADQLNTERCGASRMRERNVALYCIAEIESEAPLAYRYFKIGVAKDVRKRVAHLQTGNAKRLRPIVVDWFRNLEDARAAEKATHKHLQGASCVGEWFDATLGCPFESMAVAGHRVVSYVPRSDAYYDYPEPACDAVLLYEPISHHGLDRRPQR